MKTWYYVKLGMLVVGCLSLAQAMNSFSFGVGVLFVALAFWPPRKD